MAADLLIGRFLLPRDASLLPFSLAHSCLWQETLSVCFCPTRRLHGRSFAHLAAPMEGPVVETLIRRLIDVKKCFCPARCLRGHSFTHLAAALEGPAVEDLIRWLLDVKKDKVTGKKVLLSESEIRQRSRSGGPDTAGARQEEAQGDGEEGAAQ
jgi:hypothetical protein